MGLIFSSTCPMRLLLLLLAACFVALSVAETYYISPFGVDANDCLSTTAPCLTLQGVVDQINNGGASSANHQIEVGAGSYIGAKNIGVDISELNLALSAPVGIPRESVVFDCQEQYSVIFSTTASLALTNMTLLNCPTGVQFSPLEGTAGANVNLKNVEIASCHLGLNAQTGDVSVTNSFFNEIGGIGVLALNVQGFSLTNSEFNGNVQWGVHLITNHSLIAEHGIDFTDCNFNNGGGVSLSTGVRFDLSNLNFKGITSSNAIYMQEGSHSGYNITVTESPDLQTAIYYHSTSANTEQVTLTFDMIIISDVHTGIEFDTMGGGIIVIGDSSITHTVDGIVLRSINSLAMYSTVIMESTNSSVLIESTMENAILSLTNVDIQHSGPFDATVAGSASGSMHDCYFTSVHGHGAQINGGSWDISKCTVAGAEVDQDNVARGFYLLGRSGEASAFKISNSIFEDIQNEQGSGGGVFASDCSLTVDGCIFENNRAEYGGGISIHNYANVVIQNSIFLQNTAEASGGAIELDSPTGSTAPTIGNCTFEGNVAQIGSAIDCCNDVSECSVSYAEPSSAPNVFQGNVNSNQDAEPVNCGVHKDDDRSSAWAWVLGILAAIVFLLIIAAAVFIAYRQYNKSRHQEYETL